MQISSPVRRLAQSMLLLFVLVFGFGPPLRAQGSTGTIEGRVFNPVTGAYVERARVSVAGTTLEPFTDADGNYRLSGVPTGVARVQVFFTGLPPSTTTVGVEADRVMQHAINLAAARPERATDAEVVKLSAFIVGTPSMDGSALAINEQRFAAEMKNVVSAQEFGQVAEGNVAEMLKFMPGVSIDYGGGNARNISIGGAPSGTVPVTVGGFDLASADVGGTGRAAALDFVSINNVSRIEVLHSPTPESPGAALAGSVNMVPRSAFERARAELQGSIFLMTRDNAVTSTRPPAPRTSRVARSTPASIFPTRSPSTSASVSPSPPTTPPNIPRRISCCSPGEAAARPPTVQRFPTPRPTAPTSPISPCATI